jgi:hypothetical protein
MSKSVFPGLDERETKGRRLNNEQSFLVSGIAHKIILRPHFSANAIANYLAGILESLLAGSTIPLYWFLVGSSLGAGILLLLITPLLKYLMHGKG